MWLVESRPSMNTRSIEANRFPDELPTREKIEVPEVRKKCFLRRLAKLLTTLLLVSISAKGVAESTTVDELLKFQGLKVYAAYNELRLSELMLDHFLNGDGEPLDISADFLLALHSKYEAQSKGKNLNLQKPEEIINRYILEEFQPQYESSRPQIFAQTLQVDSDGQSTYHYRSTESMEELAGQNVRFFKVAGKSRDPDINASLGHFTLILEGTVAAVDPVKKTITLDNNAVFTVRDEYNWDRHNDQLYVPFSLGRAVDMVNPALAGDWMNDIKLISVHDRDGRVLVESGRARNFEVSARYSLPEPLIFSYNHFQQP